MPPKYYFKGTDISQCVTRGNLSEDVLHNSVTVYNSFPGVSSTETRSDVARPITLGYFKNSVDLANSRTAYYIDYDTSQNLVAPAGTTKIRAILIGGGGAGGTAGGGVHSNNTGNTDKSGGGGGGGGSGYTTFGSSTISYDSSIYITVGDGGTGVRSNANVGWKGSTSDNNAVGAFISDAGNSGNSSMIKKNDIIIYNASGGMGGFGGYHASPQFGGSGGSAGTDDINGNAGNFGGAGITVGTGGSGGIPTGYKDASLTYSINTSYGTGGQGGNSNGTGSAANGNIGGNGNPGIVRVYFLFD